MSQGNSWLLMAEIRVDAWLANWHTSSYTGGQRNCLEVAEAARVIVGWHF